MNERPPGSSHNTADSSARCARQNSAAHAACCARRFAVAPGAKSRRQAMCAIAGTNKAHANHCAADHDSDCSHGGASPGCSWKYAWLCVALISASTAATPGATANVCVSGGGAADAALGADVSLPSLADTG